MESPSLSTSMSSSASAGSSTDPSSSSSKIRNLERFKPKEVWEEEEKTSPLDSMKEFGSKMQQECVLNYIQIGKDVGAMIAAQRNSPSDPACKNGFFVPPTIFKSVTIDIGFEQEEMFGPVVTVTPFETEEEAVSVTNESKYGLVSYVYTRDHKKGLRMSRKIGAGEVFWSNNYWLFLGTLHPKRKWIWKRASH